MTEMETLPNDVVVGPILTLLPRTLMLAKALSAQNRPNQIKSRFSCGPAISAKLFHHRTVCRRQRYFARAAFQFVTQGFV